MHCKRTSPFTKASSHAGYLVISIMQFPSLSLINAKKHSLAHQLTAQLRIENSKNKKMVITLLQHIA